jgi:hypothetical protein
MASEHNCSYAAPAVARQALVREQTAMFPLAREPS